MKKTYSFILFLLAASTAFAQSEQVKLSIKLLNGTTATYNVDDIEEITFQEEQPISLTVDQTRTTEGRTYATDEDGAAVIYWDTTAPAHSVRTLSFDEGLPGYDYVVTFSYWSENPVSSVELRMIKDDMLLFPWTVDGNTDNAHCVRNGADTSAQGGEWKTATFDVHSAWEILGFNQSKENGQNVAIQVAFEQGNSVAQTFKVKDFKILPRVPGLVPEVNLAYTKVDGAENGRTVTEIEGGYKIDFPAQFNGANLDSHEIWLKSPQYLLPNCDYTLSFSYKVDTDINPVWSALFRGNWSAAGGDKEIVAAPVKDQWQEVKVNMKDTFTSFSFWGVRMADELIRLNFHPTVNGTPISIEIKDMKLIPNF